MKDLSSTCDVIIAGGGPVGVALAIELSLFNIKTIVLEKHFKPLQLPRGQLLNPRSMEFMQRWGIAEKIAKGILLPADYPLARAYCDSLIHQVYAYIALNEQTNLTNITPQAFQRIPLWLTENILRERAKQSACIDLRLGWEVLGCEQNENWVTVKTNHGELSANYLIGCDGANSTVRQHTSLKMAGEAVLSKVQQASFTAPLAKLMTVPKATLYYIFQPDLFGVISAIDGKQLWCLDLPGMEIAKENLPALLKRLTGIATDFKILTTHLWTMSSLVANKFKDGRILLAGDAAHSIPPMGGQGLNLGLGDAINLGWKLAAVLQKWGDEKLLDTYTVERKPPALHVAETASATFARSQIIRKKSRENSAEFSTALQTMFAKHATLLGIDMDYRYENSPIIIPDNLTPAPEAEDNQYHPAANPGHVLPYAKLNNKSIYDLCSAGFTLLAFKNSPALAIFTNYAQQQKIPLKILELKEQVLRAKYGADFLLIRPDLHVAWRGNNLPAPQILLATILAKTVNQ